MSEKTSKQTKTSNGDGLSLEAKVEVVLFVTPTALTIKQIADSIEVTPKKVEEALETLKESFTTRGIRLQINRGKFQLTSAPEAAPHIEKLLNLKSTAKLSQAALETLAIIAYQQPITRPGIDAVRGVNSDGVLRNLLSKGLIEESGRSEGPGRPILYISSAEFLQHFGLSSLKELPPLDIPELPEDPNSSSPENSPLQLESTIKE